MPANSRDETLALLNGHPLPRRPVFSGLPSLTAAGLRAAGLRYPHVHTDAGGMATAAASTFEMYGFEAAVAPFDLCVEAEALGCRVDFHADAETFLPPLISGHLPFGDGPARHALPEDVSRAGRVGLVAEALRRLRASVGRHVAVGAWVPGPFTLAWQLFGSDAWLTRLGQSDAVQAWLQALTDFVARVARHYRAAGADFLTVHEMGGSPHAIGPISFRRLVSPALRQLLEGLPAPRVLSVCGRTDAIVADLAACGADALSVDQCNNLRQTREVLGPRAVLLGNVDPVRVLSEGAPEDVARAAAECAAAGVSAIWPGCDLWPDIPDENFRALMAAPVPG